MKDIYDYIADEESHITTLFEHICHKYNLTKDQLSLTDIKHTFNRMGNNIVNCLVMECEYNSNIINVSIPIADFYENNHTQVSIL